MMEFLDRDDFLSRISTMSSGEQLVYAVSTVHEPEFMKIAAVASAAHENRYGYLCQRKIGQVRHNPQFPQATIHLWEWIFIRASSKAPASLFSPRPRKMSPDQALFEKNRREAFDREVDAARVRETIKKKVRNDREAIYRENRKRRKLDNRDIENYTGAEAYHVDQE